MKRLRITGETRDKSGLTMVNVVCPYCDKKQSVYTYDLGCKEDTSCECGAILVSGFVAIK